MINLLLTVGVFLLLALMWFTPNQGKAFGKRRQRIAIGIVLVSLCSFFVPLIATDPTIFGRASWSAFEVLSQLHAGTLSFRAGDGPLWAIPAFVYLSMTYLLLSAALLALLVSPSPKLVGGLAASVPLFSVVTHWGSPYQELTASLASLFYGSGMGRVDITPFATVQLVIAIALLATSYLETLDDDRDASNG